MDWSIIAWIAGLIFVYLFGIWEGRGQGYKKRKKEEQQEIEKQSTPQPEKVTETVTMTMDDPGLLRIKNEDGAYTLDLDGARVNTSALLPEQRKRLIEMLNVIRPWLEGKPAPAPAPSVAPSAPPSEELLDRLQSISSPGSSNPPPPAKTSDVRQSVPAQSAPPPAPATPPAASKPAKNAKEDRPEPPKTMVAQINAILQAQLAGTPLAERGIILAESPQGGVNVFVGSTRYDGVDEVLDLEVKAAIRAAITKWENTHTPGL